MFQVPAYEVAYALVGNGVRYARFNAKDKVACGSV